MSDKPRGYVGRFAPTPSGPLHLGSLLTAVASWVDARAHGGTWRLRIDDLDLPRVVPGAEEDILETLRGHGLVWDGSVDRQSDRFELYRNVRDALLSECFACRCSRRELRDLHTYPGTCRELGLPFGDDLALRIRTDQNPWSFDDRIQGTQSDRVDENVGDFVIWRRDGIASYQLAVVVDDAASGITHVVRGADLLDNTARQLFLIDRIRRTGVLAAPPPQYAHVPVITEASGVKLSKHTATTRIDNRFAAMNLSWVLSLLHIEVPSTHVDAMLEAAVARWNVEGIPKGSTIRDFTSC